MEESNQTKDLKFYSLNAIWAATFLGGPLAAGYMTYKNYLSIEKRSEAKTALIISIVFALFLFSILFFIPESVMNKIPSVVIPSIYSVIIYFILKSKFGEVLEEHKRHNNSFQSAWKSVLIGFISLIISFAFIFVFVLILPEDDNHKKYNTEIEKFSKNETETLVFYDYLETKPDNFLIRRLDEIIPKWEENRQLIKKLNLSDNLTKEMIDYNKLLLEYTELRIKAFKLFKKAITEQSDSYIDELTQVHQEIEVIQQKF